MYSFPYLEPVYCSMTGSNCCFLTCIQVSQEAGKMVWYSYLFENFPQSAVIHTVKGFSIVNEAEVDIFMEFSCFFYDPADIGNLISGSSAFSKSSLKIWKFSVPLLLKPGLENFEHYFDSIWNGCSCAVVWTFFGEGNGNPLQYSCLENPMDGGAWGAAVHGITEGRTRLSDFTSLEHSLALPFFGIGMKTDLFQSCGHCRVFQICWYIECNTLTASSFRIWNSSTGIPSPSLALFIVMLSKAHLTSHSRMSGSRWLIYRKAKTQRSS